MTEPRLEDLLADYAAPVRDDGFSQAVMASLPAAVPVAPATAWPWRGAIISLCLGGVAGLAWSRVGERILDAVLSAGPELASSPNLARLTDLSALPSQNLAIMAIGVGLCGWLILDQIGT